MLARRILAMMALAAAPVASAKADPLPSPVSIGLERHFTSNALDGPVARSDWYTLMRGSLSHDFVQKDGYLRVGAEFEAKRFDRIDIENDAAAAARIEWFRRVSPVLELRGTLSYSMAAVGDDLQIGALSIGTSATTGIGGAAVEAGVDLGNHLALVIGIGAAMERTGKTHFENDILPAQSLDPDKDRLQASIKLVRQFGGLALGLLGASERVTVKALGSPPVGIGLTQITARAEAAYTAGNGSNIRLALGAQSLRADSQLYSALRPTYEVSFSVPLPNSFELKGLAYGKFETSDSDDPLASWLRRGELEAVFHASRTVIIGAGVFAEVKENLLLENEEQSRGLYAEARCEPFAATALVFRVDASRTFKTVIDETDRTVDAYIGLSRKL